MGVGARAVNVSGGKAESSGTGVECGAQAVSINVKTNNDRTFNIIRIQDAFYMRTADRRLGAYGVDD